MTPVNKRKCLNVMQYLVLACSWTALSFFLPLQPHCLKDTLKTQSEKRLILIIFSISGMEPVSHIPEGVLKCYL